MLIVDPHALLLLAAILIATGSMKALYAGWTVQATEAVSRLVITQRLRYAFVMFGLVVNAGVIAGLLHFVGYDGCMIALNELIDAAPVIGYAIAAILGYALVSPLVSVATVINIYLRPAMAAYKIGFGRRRQFALTADVRAGNRKPRFTAQSVMPRGGRRTADMQRHFVEV